MHRLALLAIVPAVALATLVLGRLQATDRSPQAAYEAAEAALTAGDADRAWDLYNEAADGGHLAALATVVEGREQGYLIVRDAGGRRAGHAAVLSLPGQALLARRAFERTLADSARSGRPEVLLLLAQTLRGSMTIINGEFDPDWTTEDRDSVAAIYQRIQDADLPQFQLALLAKALGDDDAYRQHLDRAAAAGEPHACTFKLFFTGEKHDRSTAADLARYIDAADAACQPGGKPDPAADTVRKLAEQIRYGNDEAAALLDSLRAEGVFERHPRLAALVADAEA